MKNFNIELAKSGAPVCTRDGRKARIICYDSRIEYGGGTPYPIVALVAHKDNTESMQTYTIDGYSVAGEVNNKDLCMASEHHEGWVNLLRKEDGTYDIYSELFNHPVVALTAGESMGNTYVKSIKIEWED